MTTLYEWDDSGDMSVWISPDPLKAPVGKWMVPLPAPERNYIDLEGDVHFALFEEDWTDEHREWVRNEYPDDKGEWWWEK